MKNCTASSRILGGAERGEARRGGEELGRDHLGEERERRHDTISARAAHS
jgi:hypothetical protein